MILLVEDDGSVREALTFALKIEGFDVAVFEDAEALLALPARPTPACVVLDHHLPGMTGIDALAALRADGLACPAILITTQPKPDVRAAAAQLDAHLLEKPLLGGALPAALRRILAG